MLELLARADARLSVHASRRFAYVSAVLLGTTFFVLTGFHGGHVTLGVLWLLTLLVLDLRGRLGVQDAMKVEVAGLYWHFVDVVWIVIFTVVYLIP